jgi:adenylylsulfate kinase
MFSIRPRRTGIVEHNGQTAFAVWITGLPASGKSTVANALARQLRGRGINVAILESDALRQFFSAHPAYNEQERNYFYGSITFIGRILTKYGIPVIFDATANRRAYRDLARQQIPKFIEVFVDCPLEVCVQRDPKGIYKKAREGQADNVPGMQAVYEPPEKPEVVVRGDRDDPQEAAGRVMKVLEARGF